MDRVGGDRPMEAAAMEAGATLKEARLLPARHGGHAHGNSGHWRTAHSMSSSSLRKKSDAALLLRKVPVAPLRPVLANLQEVFLGTKLAVLFIAVPLAVAAQCVHLDKGKVQAKMRFIGFILILFGAGVALINSHSTAQDGDTYTALIGLVGVLGGVNLLALGFWMPDNPRACALCVWQNLGILGVVMASSAVTVVVAGAADPVLCFGLFVMLLAGLSLAACGVLGA